MKLCNASDSVAGIPGVTVVTWNQQLREGTSMFFTVFPILGIKVKAFSDPGRYCEWGRFRDKTNLRLAQGPPVVTSPGWGVRQSTGNRRKGRGRVEP